MQNLSVPVFLSLLTGLLILRVLVTRKHDKKPPGPYRWPLIGSALQMPSIRPWERLSELAKTYGDVTYLEAFKQPILVINSLEVANELLDKRSAIYSSRPHLVMAGELSAFNRHFPFAPYAEEWRAQKRFVSFALSKSMVPKYYSLQEREACKFTSKILTKPHDLFSEVSLRLGTIIMLITYGYYPESVQDPLLADMIQNVENANIALQPGVWMVDFLPMLKYLPSWMPGAGFFRTAAYFALCDERSIWNPYLWCKENLTTGKSRIPNICSIVLSEHSESLSTQEENSLAWAVGSLFGAAIHTQMANILFFFLFMCLHPEVQRKAQGELDRVIGTERLPTINDKENLPYVRSLIAEVMRMCPPFPLSVAHSLTEDDLYDGFNLEKDTMVVPNVWHILRNPTEYPSPESFNPDRYNLSDVEINKVTDTIFGFGRRVCSGIHLAEGTIFAFVSTVLATCTVRPIKDEQDRDVIPQFKIETGLVILPQKFDCQVDARSNKAVKLLDVACNVSLDE